jgi:hypothetical protein
VVQIKNLKPAPTLHERVNQERDRRIVAGAEFTITGIGSPVPMTGREQDKAVYLALLVQAQGAKAAGVTAAIHTFRDGGDTIHTLTPDQVIEMVMQAMAWFEAMMQISWDMKDGAGDFTGGIPADFQDDSYWVTT